ncbi:type IV pilus twitching motility protein PilT [Microbacterium sp. NPDC056736]|uniref:type IV pilus twitching motility protein PilT n=1 Tax=Microbacterium sp. NPDC056736 TaxID=3345932 RepID=UPI0036716B5F
MEDLDFEALLAMGARQRASDVHITAGAPPLFRVDGDLVPVPGHPEPLSEEWVEYNAFALMGEGQRTEFQERGEVDLAHATAGIGRFRTNVYRQLGSIAIALRYIPDRVYSLEELGAPAIARDLALRPRGLVLLTGPTGSGKSTTLTAMVDIVNQLVPAHIITIEDPIEFHHESKRALIHQREVGRDTNSFAEALRRVLRQDPDVILIGELRDPESISTALSAAETGHLVLSTLHTQGAAKSINRIIDVFPADAQHQIRTQLGDTLQGIISQTLLPLAQVNGRTIATEVLINTPAVANMIREGQVAQIYSAMQAGSQVGMHTLDQDLRRLVSDGTIAANVAKDFAVDPRSLDGVHIRPRELDAEDWADHAGEWRQGDLESAPANASAGSGVGMGSRFGTPTVGGRVDPTARQVDWSAAEDFDAWDVSGKEV